MSSACSLHTASASIKSSNSSLRQRNLAEITEDAEEAPPETEPSVSMANGMGDEKRVGRVSTSAHRAQSSSSVPGEQSPTRSTRTFRNTMKALPPTPGTEEVKEAKEEPVNENIRQSEHRNTVAESRPSTSARPPTRDYNTGFEYKPKVKLGPRPSLDVGTTAQTSTQYRQVSSLPAGVQMPVRKPVPACIESQFLYTPSRRTVSSRGSTIIAPPPTPNSTPRISERPTSSKSNKTITRSNPPDSKQGGMTPEKRRLMKAVQIRQKQMAAQAAAAESAAASPSGLLHEEALPLGDKYERPKTEIYSPKKEPASHTKADVDGTSFDQGHHQNPDLADQNSANPEASPISVRDVSDGASTKPSSLSSEDDLDTPKKQIQPVLEAPENAVVPEPTPISNRHVAIDRIDLEALITTDTEKMVATDREPGGTIAHEGNLAPIEGVVGKIVAADMEAAAQAPDQIPLPSIDEKELFELDQRPASLIIPSDEDQQSILTRPSTGATRPSTASTTGIGGTERAGKRKAPGSLKRVSSPDHSEDHFLSDDSFLEELKSATVQEAKPISVSKSPITPFFPRALSDPREDSVRSVSMPQGCAERDITALPASEIPRLLSPRSASASHSPTKLLPQATPSLKKVGVSSGISQRIKALEKLSSRPASPAAQNSPVVTPTSATSLHSLSSRKTSLRKRPSTSENRKTLLSTPTVEKFFIVPQSSPSIDQRGNPPPGKMRPESIDTRLASDAASLHNQSGKSEDPSTAKTTSPPIYKKPALKRQITSPTPSSISNSTVDPRRSDSVPPPRRDSLISRLSSSANLSRRGSEPDIPRSPSESSLLSGVTSLGGGEEGKDPLEKKESRKSRLLKRMSNLSSVSRKSIVSALSPPVKEAPIFEHRELSSEAHMEEKKPDVQLGDVNVQFPDSLVSLSSPHSSFSPPNPFFEQPSPHL